MRIALASTCTVSAAPPKALGKAVLIVAERANMRTRLRHDVTVLATGDSRPEAQLLYHFATVPLVVALHHDRATELNEVHRQCGVATYVATSRRPELLPELSLQVAQGAAREVIEEGVTGFVVRSVEPMADGMRS